MCGWWLLPTATCKPKPTAGRFRQDLFSAWRPPGVLAAAARSGGRDSDFGTYLPARRVRQLGRPEMEWLPRHCTCSRPMPGQGTSANSRNLMDFAAAATEEDVPAAVPGNAAASAGPSHRYSGRPDADGHSPRSRTADAPQFSPDRRRAARAGASADDRSAGSQPGCTRAGGSLISMPIRTFTGKLKTYQIVTRERQ